ncbi:hypothetical protein C8F01DRAFT_1083614 [Mycena amicta]|nr:hypothetical protein C8F01DRAFT_1083614 [Mycena amicta]
MRWFAETFDKSLARSEVEDALARSIDDVIQAISDNLTHPIRAHLNHAQNSLEKVKILFGHLDSQSTNVVLVHAFQHALLKWGGIDYMLNSLQDSTIQDEIVFIRNCPSPSDFFQGRKDILQQLDHLFKPTEPREQKVVLLYGLGGAGKTQIALKFIADSGSRFTDQFKINASSAESIEAGYRQLATEEKLGDTELHCFLLAIVQAGAFIDKSPRLKQDISRYVKLYQKNKAKLLSEKPAQSTKDYNESVYTTWKMSFDQLSQVEPLATQFLQLCSFIHFEGISEDIFERASAYRIEDGPLDPTLEILEPSFKFLSNFRDTDTTWNSLVFERVTSELCGYSLMKWQRGAYSIHPLVHQWSRTTITDLIDPQKLIVGLLGMAAACSVELMQEIQLLLHILRLSEDIDMIGTGFEAQLGSVFYAGGMYRRAETLQSHVSILTPFVQWQTLLEPTAAWDGTQMHRSLEEKVLEQQTRLLRAEHPDTIGAMANLASTYRSLGRYPDAQTLKEKVLEQRTRLLGAEHPDTIRAMADLASTYNSLRRYPDAQTLEEKVLEQQTRLLGAEHPQTIDAMGNLASTYSSLGWYTDAQTLEEKVLEQRTRLLGAEHPNTILAMVNLASTYSSLGRYTDAHALEEKVLEQRTRLLGAEHPDTILAMANLALTYSSLGRYTDAQSLEEKVLEQRTRLLDAQTLKEKVLEQRTRLLGAEHPHTIHALANLALTYSSLGRYTDAQTLEEKVLEQQTRLLGAEHPDTIRAMANLARTHSSLGRSSTGPLQSNPMSENTPSEFNPGYRAVCDVLFDENPVKSLPDSTPSPKYPPSSYLGFLTNPKS